MNQKGIYSLVGRLISVLIVLMIQTVVYSQPENARLVWSDEFSEDGAPDDTKWGYEIGGGGWGNNELQYYTSRQENVKVENGNLVITARKESYGGMNYTSSRIVTREKGDWLYGRIEIKAKLPEGRGTWPAIWMYPTDAEYGGWPSSGEIDIMEHVGYDMGYVHATIHTEIYNGALGTQKGNQIYIPDVHTAFHVYALEWTEDTLKFFADDVLYFIYLNTHTGYTTWPFDKRFFLIQNIAIGGNWGGIQGVDDEIFPQTLEVDYVRVYELFRRHSIQGPTEVNANEENISFSIITFEGAEYTWSFPEGVTIISGQGTASVNVNWGENPGTVSVIQSYEGTSYTSVLDVSTIAAPGDGPLNINSNEEDFGTWTVNPGSGNTIEMEYEE